MIRILKYVVKHNDVVLGNPQEIIMTLGAEILDSGFDNDSSPNLCIWAAVDDQAPKCRHEVVLEFTGRARPPAQYDHLGSHRDPEGIYVWHLFISAGELMEDVVIRPKSKELGS